MSEAEINIAIAEVCGWKMADHPDCMARKVNWTMPEKWIMTPQGELVFRHCVPNYTGDLNAMHEAEEKLNRQWGAYVNWLVFVVFGREFDSLIYHAYVTNATARQRAEAFLRTLGKWKEGV